MHRNFILCELYSCADQRGFPQAGRGRAEGNAPGALQALVQPLDQVGMLYNFRWRWGTIEFRNENRCRHSDMIKHVSIVQIGAKRDRKHSEHSHSAGSSTAGRTAAGTS